MTLVYRFWAIHFALFAASGARLGRLKPCLSGKLLIESSTLALCSCTPVISSFVRSTNSRRLRLHNLLQVFVGLEPLRRLDRVYGMLIPTGTVKTPGGHG